MKKEQEDCIRKELQQHLSALIRHSKDVERIEIRLKELNVWIEEITEEMKLLSGGDIAIAVINGKIDINQVIYDYDKK